MPKPDIWLTKKQVMKKLDRSERTVENLVTAGKIVARMVKEGAYTRPLFSERSVEAYKAARDNPGFVPIPGYRSVGATGSVRGALPPPAAAPAEEEETREFDSLPAAARLTLREACRYLRVPLPWMRSRVANGHLPYDDVFDGRQGIRIRKGDLDYLEAEHTAGRRKK